jgi:hypothetical protein
MPHVNGRSMSSSYPELADAWRTSMQSPYDARLANAQRSGAGWVPSEINCTAGWIRRRSVVEMALPVIVIRWLTDERGAQTRVASARARVLADAVRA